MRIWKWRRSRSIRVRWEHERRTSSQKTENRLKCFGWFFINIFFYHENIFNSNKKLKKVTLQQNNREFFICRGTYSFNIFDLLGSQSQMSILFCLMKFCVIKPEYFYSSHLSHLCLRSMNIPNEIKISAWKISDPSQSLNFWRNIIHLLLTLESFNHEVLLSE